MTSLKWLLVIITPLMLSACAPEQSTPTAHSAFDEEAGPWQTVEINGVLYRRAAAKPTETAQGDLLITIPIQWESTSDGSIRLADTVQIAGRTYTADCNQTADDDGNSDETVDETVTVEVSDDVGNTIDTAADWTLNMPAEGTAGRGSYVDTVSEELYLEEVGDEDFFRIQIPRRVEFSIQSVSHLDTQAWLYDQSGLEIDYNDDNENHPGELNFVIFGFLEPGTYYLRVAGHSNTTGLYYLYAVVGNAPDKG